MTQLIGLTGYATSGKDTAAQALLDLGWERRAFADPLRNCLLTLNPIVSAQPARRLADRLGNIPAPNPALPGVGINYLRLDAAVEAVGWDEAKKLPEIRRLLQVFGTEVVRDNFGSDSWIRIARESLAPGIDYVFTDCRFPNEVEMIHHAGGIVVKVMRPGVRPVNAHASDDIDRLLVDHTVMNDGSIEQLHAYMRDLIS